MKQFLHVCVSRRPDTSAADRPVPGAGVQTFRERAESSAASCRQPQEPHPEAARAQSSRTHEVGSGCTGERVRLYVLTILNEL